MARSYQARNAARGIDAERRAQKELEAAGYCVTRAAGSHGPFDLIASNEQECLHLQIKSVMKDRSWLPVLKELAAAPAPRSCYRYLWVRVYRKRGWARRIFVPVASQLEEEHHTQ